MKNNLDLICEKYGGSITTIHRGRNRLHTGGDTSKLGYTTIYYKNFLKFQQSKINFLEIGIFQGKGLAMWSEFFSNGKIYGIDINTKEYELSKDNLIKSYNAFFNNNLEKVFETDTSTFDENVIKTLPQLDIIIDDGAHDHKSQYSTFINYFPKIKKGGMYAIEDIRHYQQLISSLNINPYLKNIENIETFSFKNHQSKLVIITKK